MDYWYIAPDEGCTIQYRVTRANGITRGSLSWLVATRDAIVTRDPVLDGTSPLRVDVFA